MATVKANVFAYDNGKRIAILDGKKLNDIIQELTRINNQIGKTTGVHNDFVADTIGGDCIEEYGYKIL